MDDFGGRVDTGEAVDVDLRSIGAAAGAGQRLQLLRKLVGIVGQCRELLFPEDQRVAVIRGVGAHAVGFGLDIDYLVFRGNDQLHVERRGICDLDLLALDQGESLGDEPHGVLAGFHCLDGIFAGGIGGCALIDARPAQLHQRTRNGRAGWVGDHAVQAGAGLRHAADR
jgi:hypothetical protein